MNNTLTSIQDTVRKTIKKQGRTQKWVTEKMNSINPSLDMDRSKFSAIITGNRKMTGDELLAFCMALEISPDVFTEQEKEVV